MLISAEYEDLVIKRYRYWTLVLNEKQLPYLGRCYAWWNDRKPGEGENLPFDAVPDKAFVELKKIAGQLREAYYMLGYEVSPYGKRFLLNVAQLSNLEAHNHHLHAHFIPRSSVIFKCIGIEVKDLEWGQNYAKPLGGEHMLPRDDYHEIIKLLQRGLK